MKYTAITWKKKSNVYRSLLETDDGAWVKWKGYFFLGNLYDSKRNLICRYRRDSKERDYLYFPNKRNVRKVSFSGGKPKKVAKGAKYELFLDGCDDCVNLANNKKLIDAFYYSAK